MTVHSKKELFEKMLKAGAKVMRVTREEYYVTYPNEQMSERDLKKDWFGDKLNRSHAYRDNSKLGNGDAVLDVKFMTLDDVKKMTD